MRLLVVSQYFWPENFRINDLVAEMVRRGHDVTVLTGVPNYPTGVVDAAYRRHPEQYAMYEGARIVRVPMVPRGRGGMRLVLNYLSFAISASLVGLWKLRGRAFDAILVYEPSPVTVGIPSAVMRAVKRAPMAFWVLDLWPETLRAVGVVKSGWMLKLVGRLVSAIYQRCDLILAQSRSFIAPIRHYAGAERRIEYFPSWAESVFDGTAAEPALEVAPAAGSFSVMFAGNIGEAQDFPAILAAAEALKNHTSIRWLVVGDGRMSAWVAREIAARDLGRSVRLLGRYPVERMPSFFRHADALLVSLKDEPIFALTIPGKLQSYLAAGTPVIAMLNGEGAELLADAEAGLTCAAGDAAGLAQAVLRLAGMSAAQRQAMGERGLALYAREFERRLLLDRLEGWLLELAATGMAAGRRP
jgi:glycosyltransferase involved in cell wall biosynthesis